MFEEYKKQITELQDEIKDIRGYLDIPSKNEKLENLRKETTKPDFWSDNKRARKIMKKLDSIKSDINIYEDIYQKASDISTLIQLAEEEKDKSVEDEISGEIKKLKRKVERISFRLKLSGENDRNDAIMTLNAGAGGTEACDWVEMLARMYKMWASNNDYKIKVVEVLPGDEAGLKKITLIIQGDYAYGYLKGESGVHRLVRVSPFDSSSRRHTSFAACDIIPKIEEDIELDINENDLRIDTYRASGHGGQHVNKTDSAVRITHLPTGIVVQSQDSPSQHSNKKTALSILKARLYEFEQDKKRKATQRRYDEKGEIGWGNQIRSYVFMPYQMVRDHRTGLKFSNIDSVMNGNIDPFIESYLEHKA
ncbi:MAG: peptide chain release factor 2 [Elusimicrobiota bacterium]